MLRSWRPSGLLVLTGVIVTSSLLITGSPGAAAMELVFFAAIAALFSPVAFPRSPGAVRAQQLSRSDGRPVIYWRVVSTACGCGSGSAGRRAERTG